MRAAAAVIVFLVSVSAHAADARLERLAAALLEMRRHASTNGKTRGATPQLTVVKHELRDWIESRLSGLAWDDDETELARSLNNEIKQANLFCCTDDSDENLVGFLGKIDLHTEQRGSFLVVQTRVGILCGFDESAYVYKWNEGRWQRIWQSEQNIYTEREYAPQSIHGVLISPSLPDKSNPLVLTLGYSPWCSSNWHPVYYRLWRMSSDRAEPKLLLDETQVAYLGGADTPIQGSVRPDDVLIEFAVFRSTDAGGRQAIRHYRIQQDVATRIDPVALTPRDFVDEWRTRTWSESAAWSDNSAVAPLQQSHKELHSDSIFGEYLVPTLHCADRVDTWQVGVDFERRSKYFLLRWRPPYHFTMLKVSDRPSANCTEEDPEADEPRTLFPNWR